MIEISAIVSGTSAPTSGAEDEQQDDQRRGKAELQLALLEILLGDLLKVEPDGELPRDVDREAVLSVGRGGGVDDVLDAVDLLVLDEGDREEGRVAVLGDQHLAGAVEVARHVLDPISGGKLIGQALDPLAKRRILRSQLL